MKRALLTLAVVVVAGLSTGIDTGKPNAGALVARAQSLNPQPIPPQPPVQPIVIEVTETGQPYTPPAADLLADGIHGSTGYARAGGNCVNEPGVKNPRTGNPISWAAASRQHGIGKTVLFTWNHVGVETGYRVRGHVVVSIFVRHQNCGGCPTEYPLGMVRGFI